MAHKFRGTGVALVTPFQDNETVDFAALEKLVNRVIDNGVNYLVALGTTGETTTLDESEKRDVLSFITDKCGKRVPVVCGIGGNNTKAVINNIANADLTGVEAILTVAPYYNKPTQTGLYQHFKAIAESTGKDIILYNVPGRSSVNISAETSLKLANEFKNIVAIKEASGNLAQCMELVAGKPDHFAILSGDDDLVMPQIALGMEGVISVAANCFTKDFTDMVNSALEGDFNTARKLHYKLIDGIRLLFAEGNPGGVKCVLTEMGIGGNNLRLPLVPVSEDTHKKIKGYLSNI